ncbi:hypothetical protein LDL08_42275 [Nonomuraea glycinis]|uniref:hypothetical protein n=1 Tax=Nonomuraea glycinis TaxID=2047744 RepID=UPI0016653DC2|nr:hypothetical protein [Nonomuraea glycinis]MCA2182807.1 hypothetical protein [Nonomuraea glycinis]
MAAQIGSNGIRTGVVIFQPTTMTLAVAVSDLSPMPRISIGVAIGLRSLATG